MPAIAGGAIRPFGPFVDRTQCLIGIDKFFRICYNSSMIKIVREQLDEMASKRILIIDGAMGSLIQSFGLTEEDYRGQRFADFDRPLKGCNDLLCITRPAVVLSIHEDYLRAGADIIETCSLNSTSVGLADYGLADLSYEISFAAAALAKKAADKFSTPEWRRFAAGSIGPTSKSASISPDMDDPGKRGIYWDELEASYYDHIRGLLDGGSDFLLIETIFDTLNVKAALGAISRIQNERQIDIPVMISGTVSDDGGRILSGQTVEAFCVSLLHAEPWALGLNCSFGAEKLRAHIRSAAAAAPCRVIAYPNAGMPNQMGAYDETPEFMASCIEDYMKEGLVNIVGGCCGSTPAHIALIAERAKKYAPRITPEKKHRTVLSGFEPLLIEREKGLINIGERTNVAGSRKFLRLIREEKYTEALGIARDMIAAGAQIIDICMDDAMLDAQNALCRFVSLALSDPDIVKAPFMIDSSRWEVIEAALKLIQGKALVNSISLKEGEAEFLRRSRSARHYGAAVVVMLFDEQGQAASYERKIEVAARSYRLLTGDGFPPEDIVFDPNVLAVATGIPEHDSYALDFIRATAWIRDNCPHVQISGGISNLSFSFRGSDTVREAMHAVFIKHAVAAGLTLAIVNPAGLIPYDEIDPPLREAAEDLILCRNAESKPAERLLALALAPALEGGRKNPGDKAAGAAKEESSWRNLDAADRIVHAMIKGIDEFIEADVLELRPRCARSLEIVEGPLMRGMGEVGERFSTGKMFLPQVIRSARVMKKAVAALEPFINEEKTTVEVQAGKVLVATVKGDVHDIGKNIAAVVLGCNGFSIVDLGVMVPAETIINAAIRENVDVIGLSGLITPSLDEMINTVKEMEKRNLKIPVIIGGAAASLVHTALRIAPCYSGPVIYVKDAGESAAAVHALRSVTERPRFLENLEQSYRNAAARHETIKTGIDLIPLTEARKNRFVPAAAGASQKIPAKGVFSLIKLEDYEIERVLPYIDWAGFLHGWELGKKENAMDFLDDAKKFLKRIINEKILCLRGVVGFFPARSDDEDLVIFAGSGAESGEENGEEKARFCFLRNQEKKKAGGSNLCLADYIGESGDYVGLFALSAGFGLKEAEDDFHRRNDDYGALLAASLANSLAEAFSEEVHQRVRREWWGYDPDGKKPAGIRPAFGYPACPDHRDKETAFRLLEAQKIGLELSESAMILPAASVSGIYFAHPESCYFAAGAIANDQLEIWAQKKGINTEEARKRTGRI
ncbi:methionine synthase [Spirochaetia bacterium]|nr:methionine synthase [Spirochaetia bacterium]